MSRGVFIHVECGHRQKPRRLAEAQKIDDAPSVARLPIPRPLVGRPAVAGARHLLPAVLRRVHHRPAVPQHRQPLREQTPGHVPPHRQPLEPPPITGLEKYVPDLDRARLLQHDRKASRVVLHVRRQRELELVPVARRTIHPGLGIYLFPVAALQAPDKKASAARFEAHTRPSYV